MLHLDDIDKWDADKLSEYHKNKYEICKEANLSVIAEIGVRAGYSAYKFLEACPTAKFYGFDNNQGKHRGAKDLKYHNWAKEVLREFNIFLRPDFDSLQQEYLVDEDGNLLKADFVHVDADHSYEGCRHDLKLALKSDPKVILVDDYDYVYSVKKATDEFVLEHSSVIKETKHIRDMRGQLFIYLK